MKAHEGVSVLFLQECVCVCVVLLEYCGYGSFRPCALLVVSGKLHCLLI